jgi:hypothetical protein
VTSFGVVVELGELRDGGRDGRLSRMLRSAFERRLEGGSDPCRLIRERLL